MRIPQVAHAEVEAQPNRPKVSMDLWWNAVDLPLNPMWGYQVGEKGTSNGQVPDAGDLCNHFTTRVTF